jgi:hypothetical protein
VSWAVFGVALTATCLLLVRHAYRGADAIGRRRLKWFLFGMYAASVPMLAGFALAAVDPRFIAAAFLSVSALALLPVSLLIAVARYNLFDIDRVISATASYNALLILLISGGLVVVPRAAQAASSFLGLDPTAGQVLVSALLAGFVVPSHRRLRPQIERILFAERHTVDQGMARLLTELSECPTPGELPTRLAEGLDAVMRPTCCICYGRDDSGYRPLFAQGRTAPPSIEVANPVVSTVHRCRFARRGCSRRHRGRVHGGRRDGPVRRLDPARAEGTCGRRGGSRNPRSGALAGSRLHDPRALGGRRHRDRQGVRRLDPVGRASDLDRRRQRPEPCGASAGSHSRAGSGHRGGRRDVGAAEQAGQGFERHPNTPIRGRQQTADVYTLPLAGA